MKNVLRILAITAFLPVAVLAQSTLDEEVNAELDKMYQAQPAAQPQQAQRSAGPAVQVNVQAAQSANQAPTAVAAPVAAPVAVAPTAVAPQTTQAVVAQPQKQPTTVIQASPLVESKAEMIRKNRQDAEVSTEQGIVEKLEESRLQDEKKRAEVLFGDKFNTLMNQPAPQAQPAPAPAPVVAPVITPVPQQAVVPAPLPVQEVQPALPPVIIEKEAKSEKEEEKLDREAVRGEVNAALAEFKKESDKPKTSSYIAVMAGSADYPDAINVKGQYSIGAAYGHKFTDRMIGEGSFLFSNYQVEQPASYGNGGSVYDPSTGQYVYYPRITEMNQYSTSGLVKYQLLGGTLRPEVGALMSYTYRTFSDKQFALSDATVTSQALDFGVMTGVAIEMSESFALGLDFRYMWNMTNKVDGTSLQKSSIYQGSSNYTPIEQLSYYNLSVVGRASF
jgi:hypothetical protein